MTRLVSLESGHLVNQDTLSSVLTPTMYMYVVSPAVVEAQVEAIAQGEGLTLEEAKVSRDSIYPVSASLYTVLDVTFVSHSVCDVFQMVLLREKTPSKQFVMPNEVDKVNCA